MKHEQKEFLGNLKVQLGKGDISTTLDVLNKYLKKLDEVLFNEVISKQQAFSSIESEYRGGRISYDEYQRAINKLTKSLLYFIDQIPKQNQEEKKQKKKGKLLHDIPNIMPVDVVTKCIIRIADNEELLLENFNTSTDTVLEDIPTAKIMQVELIDFSEESNFYIRTPNNSEQTIQEGEYTQWLFYVKPIRAGLYDLFLKISIIQYIENKDRKKEIILERNVKVISELEDIPNRAWNDTHIYIKNIDRTPNVTIKQIKKGLSLIAFILVSGIAVAAYIYVNYASKPELNPAIHNNNTDSTHQVNIPAQKDSLDLQSSVIDIKNYNNKSYEIPNKFNTDSKNNQPSKILEDDRQPTSDKNLEIYNNSKVEIEKTEKPSISDLLLDMKRRNYVLLDKLEAKDTVETGLTTYLTVTTNGFDLKEIDFLIENQHKIKPVAKDGSIFYFELKSVKKQFLFTIVDKDSGNSVERTLNGNTSYQWNIKRRVVDPAAIGIDR